MKQIIFRNKIWLFSIILTVLCFSGCGGGGGDSDAGTAVPDSGTAVETPTDASTGGIRFRLQIEEADQRRSASQPVSCEEDGISTVEAYVYDEADTLLATGGPWPCTAHSGIIDEVPPGDNRSLAVILKNSAGKEKYRANVTGIHVRGGEITDVGIITAQAIYYIEDRNLWYVRYADGGGEYQADVSIYRAGQPVQSSEISSVVLKDPGGKIISQGLQYGEISESGRFPLQITEGLELVAGNYTFEAVAAASGQHVTDVYYFSGQYEIPIHSSSAMTYEWLPDESLKLSWENPPGTYDRIQVDIKTAQGVWVYSEVLNSNFQELTLPAAWTQEQKDASGNIENLKWTMQTLAYTNVGNVYAKGVSNEVLISLTVSPDEDELMPPENVSAEPFDGQVRIRWESVGGADQYIIYWSLSPDVSTTGYQGTLSTTSILYIHNVDNCETYYYVVTALSGTGESDPSPMVSASPPGEPEPPVGLTVSQVNGTNILNWESVYGAESYNVYWSFSPTVTKEDYDGAENNVLGTTFEHNYMAVLMDVGPSEIYYTVTAVNCVNESEPSLIVSTEIDGIVNFPDSYFEGVIREAINKPSGDIYISDLQVLEKIEAPDSNISSIEGIQYCSNLTELNLGSIEIDGEPINTNQISDIAPLAELTNLFYLDLDANNISDLTPLADMAELAYLYLKNNEITDISPLQNLTSLAELYLSGNQISNLSPLSGLTGLATLGLWDNLITDITSLAALTNLNVLYISSNPITDIAPLENLIHLKELYAYYTEISDLTPLEDLMALTEVDVYGCPLDENSCYEIIPNLESRDVMVLHSCN